MKSKDIRKITEAYNSIYEANGEGSLPGNYRVFGGQRYSVKPDGSLTYPTDNRTKPTSDELTAVKPSLDAASARRSEIRNNTQTEKPIAQTQPVKPGTVAVASGKGGTVTVGKQYDATLSGKPVKVSYDASGSRTVTPVSQSSSASPASSNTSSSIPTPTPTTPAQKSFQQELDDLRKAAAKATLTGPSKEAQALMSQRTKNILGKEKLEAGIKAQQEVEKMKSEIGTPKPAPTSPSTTAAQPKPEAPPPPKAQVPDRSKDYQRAWDNRNNPFAKGRIKDAWSKMSPEEKASAKEWAKANNKNWQEMGLSEQRDIYDEVLEILLDEGYSEKECNQIMVQLVNEGIWDAVKQRTGIGKPGVGPGQVAKNILRAGITDILGTSIATGSTPSSVSAAKPSPAATTSPAPQVRVSTQTIRKAPKGANKITTNVWNEPFAPSSRINPSKPSGPRITSTRALPGTNVRGLLSQAAKNISPNPWNQVSDSASGAKNLFSRVKEIIKPQAQLKGSQTAGQLPQGRPGGSLSNVVKTDIVKQNVKTGNLASANIGSGGVTSSSRPSTTQATQLPSGVRGGPLEKAGPVVDVKSSKPSPSTVKPSGNVDKIAPKPTRTAKPSVKPKTPGGGSNLLQGLGTLASLRKLTPYGIAAAVMEPRPTADGTLDAAKKRGDLNKGATNWVDPMPTPEILKRSGVSPKQEVKPVQTGEKPKSKVSPVVKKPTPAKPVDPDVQQYEKLKKSDPAKAKELGMKIWSKKYRPALTPPDIA